MHKNTTLHQAIICLLTALTPLPLHSAPAEKADDGISRIISKDMTVIVGSRTPEQLAAFYAGRGFNPASIEAITGKCFVFGMVENNTDDIVWLILDDWKFYAADGSEMKRWKKSDWQPVWKETGLSQAHQSTFGWTQLPESRDLRQHEHVGGNVVVEWKDEPFKLIATLKTGADKSGKPRIITVENLTCKAK